MKTKGLKKNLSLDKIKGIRIDTGPVTYVPVVKEYKFPTPEKSIKNKANTKKDGWKYQEKNMIKKWIDARMKERTTWDGAMLIALGLMILFLAPLAKIAAGVAILYGGWTIWKKD